MEPKQITWEDLKKLANSLNEEQLTQPVRWWGDERGGEARGVEILDEDHKSDGEFYYPESEIEPGGVDEDSPVITAGTPILWVD